MALPGFIGRTAEHISGRRAALAAGVIVGGAAVAGLWSAHPARPIFQGAESMFLGDPNAFNKMRQAALGGALYRGIVPGNQQTELGALNAAGYGYGDDYSGFPENSGPVERANPATRNPTGPAGDPANISPLYAQDFAAQTARARAGQDAFRPTDLLDEGVPAGAIPSWPAPPAPVGPGYALPAIPRGHVNRIPTPDGAMVFGLYNDRMR